MEDVGIPTVIIVRNIAIRVYANDHPPARFHLVSPTFHAKVAIEGLAIIESSTAIRDLRPALDGASRNIETIRATWERFHGD